MTPLTRPTIAEREATLVFRVHLKSKNPNTSLHTAHTWSTATSMWCTCGRFHSDDPRLSVVTLPRADLLLCKRCTWADWGAETRLNA